MNRKGQGGYIGESWTDIILVPIFLFLVAVIMLFTVNIWNTINEETIIFDEDQYEGVSKEAISDIKVSINTVMNMYSYIFIMLVASMLVGMTITGFLTDSPLILLVPSGIILMVAIILSVPLGNAYEEITQLTEFALEASGQSIILQIMQNMPLTIFIIGASFLIVSYGKKSFFGGGVNY